MPPAAHGGQPPLSRGRPLRRRVAAHAVDEERVEAVGELDRVASRAQPRIRPVGGREEQQRGARVVQVRAQLAELSALAKQRTHALLVAPALADDLVAALALEIAPLAD